MHSMRGEINMINIPTTENITLQFHVLVALSFVMFVIGAKIGYEVKEFATKYKKFISPESGC